MPETAQAGERHAGRTGPGKACREAFRVLRVDLTKRQQKGAQRFAWDGGEGREMGS